MHYRDFADGQERNATQHQFRKKPKAQAETPIGTIQLAVTSSDNCRMRSVIQRGRLPWAEAAGDWLILSQGAGFNAEHAAFVFAGPDTGIYQSDHRAVSFTTVKLSASWRQSRQILPRKI